MKENFSSCLQKLHSPSETERINAASFLGDAGDRHAVPYLLKTLQYASFGKVFLAIVNALGALKDPDAVPALGKAYQGARSDLYRLPILRAFEKIGTPNTIPFLLLALQSKENSPLCIVAANALSKIAPLESVFHLLQVFEHAKDPEPFAKILCDLGRKHPSLAIGDKIVAKLFFASLSLEAKLCAIEILGTVQASGVIGVLDALCTHEERKIQHAAKQALQKIAHTKESKEND